MTDKTITAIVEVLLAITGLAILAALVSKQSQTGAVFGAGGNAISQAICTALSPVTGQNCKGFIESVNSTIVYQ